MHLQENTLFDLDVKVTQNVAIYPLHHVTNAAIKFEVARSNGLGGDTITRNMTDRRTGRWTMDGLWYEINIPFFLKKKEGIATVYELINELFENIFDILYCRLKTMLIQITWLLMKWIIWIHNKFKFIIKLHHWIDRKSRIHRGSYTSVQVLFIE